MWLATQLGNIVTAFTVAFVFFWLNYRDLAVGITLGTITLWILVETVKALADRARPFLVLEGTRIIGWRERGRPPFRVVTPLRHFPGDAFVSAVPAGSLGNYRSLRGRRAGWFYPDVRWRSLSTRCHRRGSVRFCLGVLFALESVLVKSSP